GDRSFLQSIASTYAFCFAKSKSDSPTGHQKDNIRTKKFGCCLFIQADAGGLAWHPSLATEWNHGEYVHASRASVYLRRLDSIHPVGMIPYATSSQFHTAISVAEYAGW
ncbi:MAG: hypothetical protein IKL40_00690, partial [Clostridia bacterium]|nr:hypothetical protein [Clostridia bacterium]